MRAAIIYSSVTGNTMELALLLHGMLARKVDHADLFSIEDFPAGRIDEYDAIVIGTYTWGDGEIPEEMKSIYRLFEVKSRPNLVTAVFGTGDSFYPHFCGAVNIFRDLLKTNTKLAVTLKVELLPQLQDHKRCVKFIDLLLERLYSKELLSS
ncbi:flavodoxin domain-containing protein [Bacillus sp. S/N-304-OC-R1]|uniref:flavodoxin domain-containing protein n=1 Tax=Bacillus sp. S/N-304-OC-R1 TaxID=2758034 RepID=UPI001C8EDC73|nr:flavodoxin domain-containing protein [Bacillus sp. S/N-304-OC-R1]MBY0121324.1 flavodoxin domain-containing protein [Bacillus sp. S/N-304-OC-R1]